MQKEILQKLSHNKIKIGLVAVVVTVMAVGVLTSGNPVASQEEEPSAWLVRCNDTAKSETDKSSCEVFQRLVMQETGQRVVEFAVGFPEGKEVARGVLILPLGVLLPEGGQMQIDDGQAFQFKLRYCTTDGCYAFLDVGTPLLNKMAAGENIKLIFKAMDGQGIALDLPLRGFTKTIEKLS